MRSRALARLLRAQPNIAAVTRDRGAGDLAVLDLAVVRADHHRAAGNGLVGAGLEIAEDENVLRSELDHLAAAHIVHELDVGGRAFDVFHQRGRDQGGGGLRRGEGRTCEDAATAATSVLSAIKTVSM
jgi:hypothetical protein